MTSIPYDVLKTRRQTWLTGQPKPSLASMAKIIIKEEGVRALTKGMPAYFLAECIGLSSYFFVKRKVNEALNETPKMKTNPVSCKP